MEKLEAGKPTVVGRVMVNGVVAQKVTIEGVLSYDEAGIAALAQLHRVMNDNTACEIRQNGLTYKGAIQSLATEHRATGVKFEAVLLGELPCLTE